MIRGAAGAAFAILLLTSAPARPQTRTMTQGAHRMELSLERYDGKTWKTIDPGTVLEQADRVRFRFRTNFDGFLYVTNLNTSGKYEQLFPGAETGRDNKVVMGREYQVPSTDTVFKISGPAGYETVYWLVSPGRLSDASPTLPANTMPSKPLTDLKPRCDDQILRARGDCIDSSAGLKLVPRGEDLPQGVAQATHDNSRELLFMRQQGKAVVASTAPLTGPVIYEFRLAHK
jgi:hypothetical protein